jgi:hypothetical protein
MGQPWNSALSPHQMGQALPPHHRRPVVRFVGYKRSLYPPSSHACSRTPHNVAPRIQSALLNRPAQIPHSIIDTYPRFSRVAICAAVCYLALPPYCADCFVHQVNLEVQHLNYQCFFNQSRTHSVRSGATPVEEPDRNTMSINNYRWKAHCRGLFELPIVA